MSADIESRRAGADLAAWRVAARPGPLRLEGAIQRYAWGGYRFIPELVGLDNSRQEPMAELWVGTHPVAPALVDVDGTVMPLSELVARAPEAIIGPALAARGSSFPYLFKVLDVRAMLSIQAHPNRRQAEEGFARESAALIPVAAAERNYRDANHKPEASVALTDVWVLHGFKPVETIAEQLQAVPELRPLAAVFHRPHARAGGELVARSGVLRSLYERVMTLPQADIDTMLDPLLARLSQAYDAGTLDRSSPDFWAARAARLFPIPGGHRDRGIISIYLLNVVRLRPGQGTYVSAGVLHGYLEGVAVEIMASSDNVVRGGLTSKHVDPQELLRVLFFEGGSPPVLDGVQVSPTERVYPTPAEEFAISRIEVAANRPHHGDRVYGADSLLAVEGEALVSAAGGLLSLGRGGIALVPNGLAYTVSTASRAVLFRASVPPPARA